MRKTIVSLILVCFVFSNILFLDCVEAAVATPSPAIQTAVFQIATFIQLPFVIMNDILREVPVFPEYAQPAKGRDRGKNGAGGSRSNACYFFSNPSHEVRKNLRSNDTGISLPVSRTAADDREPAGDTCLPAAGGVVCLYLLLYFIALSKSNLPGKVLHVPFIEPGYAYCITGLFHLGDCRE